MAVLSVHEDMQRFADSGIVAVMHGADAGTITDVADALHEGGVTAYEVMVDNPDVTDLIREVSASFSDSEAVVGVGTALGTPITNATAQAGAEFVIGPNFGEDVVETCNRYGTLVVPGIMTLTEVTDARSTGADLVKVFLASSLGPGHLESMKGSLPQIPMIPTDNVDLDNAVDYIKAGVVVVGAGSTLMDDEAIGNDNLETITETARELSNIIDDARDD